MKLDPKTFNASIHKVTLKGSPVEIVGFGVGKHEGFAFYRVSGCTNYCMVLEDFEVTTLLEMDTKVLVSMDKREWYPGHLSHFDEDGDIWVWDDGRTSFTNTDGNTYAWPYWKFPDKL